MWRNLISPTLYAGLGTFIVFLSLQTSFAQVMQSSSYRIQSDSINFAGGNSTSSNYVLESTVGEVGTGISNSNNYSLRAGYQQMHEVYISMSGAGDITLLPAIPGVTGGTATGSTTVTVTTDSFAGYSLSIAAESSPALVKGADSIADYVPAGNPDFTFTTGPADSHFGYSPQGADVVQRFKDNGASCNAGVLETANACWDGLLTSDVIISSASSANNPSGATTSIMFRVGVGSSVAQSPGIYTATTTITALPL